VFVGCLGELMEWYVQGLKKYVVFQGRAHRREFWMFYVVNCAIAIGLELIGFVLTQASGGSPYTLAIVYNIAVFLPTVAVTVRRLHDTGHGGAWYFIAFVPLVGFIVLLVLLATEGQHGPNHYGSDPLGAATAPFAAAAPGTAPAAWLRDPTGRHELRYWDSRQWTEHVSDAGAVSTDML